MEKKTLVRVAFITILLFSATVVTQLLHLGKANPIMHYWVLVETVAPDQNTKPPTILMLSPQNNTVYGVDTVSLSLNVSIGESSTASSCVLDEIYYKTDWQSTNISVYKYSWNPLVYPSAPPRKTEFSKTINLTGIPDGNHAITIYAVENGDYELYVRQDPHDIRNFAHYYNNFTISGCSLVRFTVDTTLPRVSILSPLNGTYDSPDVPLNFTVNEKSSLIAYSLDSQKTETINGNTTLTNLSYGEHNVTVYATDIAGNVGASETVSFNVAEPEAFLTASVVAASAVTVTAMGLGLLVYFRKYKR